MYANNGNLYGFIQNNTNIYYYIRDILGNILGIVNDSGVLVAKYDYDAYGNLLSSTGNIYNPFRYKGYYYDERIELYYLKSRFYSPWFRRFLTPDNINYLDVNNAGCINLYAYCNNNPVMYVDPDGEGALTALLITSFLASFALGAGMAVYDARKNDLSLGDTILSALGEGLLAGTFAVAMVLGGAAGLSITGFALSTHSALYISSAMTASASLINYFTHSIAYKETIYPCDAMLSFVKGGFQGALTFGIGFFGGKNHMFDNLLGKNINDIHLILTVEAKNSVISKALLGAESLFGAKITRTVFFGGSAWLIRKIVEWMM